MNFMCRSLILYSLRPFFSHKNNLFWDLRPLFLRTGSLVYFNEYLAFFKVYVCWMTWQHRKNTFPKCFFYYCWNTNHEERTKFSNLLYIFFGEWWPCCLWRHLWWIAKWISKLVPILFYYFYCFFTTFVSFNYIKLIVF